MWLHLPPSLRNTGYAAPMVLAGSGLGNHIPEDLLKDLQWLSTAQKGSRTNLSLHSNPLPLTSNTSHSSRHRNNFPQTSLALFLLQTFTHDFKVPTVLAIFSPDLLLFQFSELEKDIPQGSRS